MPSERNNVRFPMWRKKMDASMFEQRCTYIPEWVIDDLWGIRETFSHSSRKNPESEVDIEYSNPSGKTTEHEGWITTTRYDGERNDVMRLFLDEDVIENLKRDFAMTYHRAQERIHRGWNSPKVEKEIPFWEFLDIEFDEEEFLFILTPHYNLPEMMMDNFTYLKSDDPTSEPRPEASTESEAPTPAPSPSNYTESIEITIRSLRLEKEGNIRNFKWYRMPDGRIVHLKYSRFYDDPNHQNYWYGVTPKSLAISKAEGITHFGFVAGRNGCVLIGIEELLGYVSEAKTSINDDDYTIRHFHFFMDRDRAPFLYHLPDRRFEYEYVPFG